jgi:ATP-dependent Clp protease adapter protein ClpS
MTILQTPLYNGFQAPPARLFAARIHQARDELADNLWLYTTRRFDPPKKKPESDDTNARKDDDQYEVRIIDNDYNTYDEVINIVMLALGVTFEEAYAAAWEVDHMGSCVVAQGPWDTCVEIASIIETIGIETQVNPKPRARI